MFWLRLCLSLVKPENCFAMTEDFFSPFFFFLHFVLQPLLACITDTVGTVVIVLGLLFILLFSSSVSNHSCYNSCDLLPYVIFVMSSTSSEGEFLFLKGGFQGIVKYGLPSFWLVITWPITHCSELGLWMPITLIFSYFFIFFSWIY